MHIPYSQLHKKGQKNLLVKTYKEVLWLKVYGNNIQIIKLILST